MSMLAPALVMSLTAIIQGIGCIIFPRQTERALGQLEAALKSANGEPGISV
jgi:uncharacterized protein YjeT (DUF2065 family)